MNTVEHKAGLWEVLWEHNIGGLALVAEDGTFIRANPAFCKIVEFSEPELQAQSFRGITVPMDADIDTQLADDVIAGKLKSYDMVKSYITKTNRVVWVHLRVVPMMVDDKFSYFVSQVFEVPVSIVRQMDIDMQTPKYRPVINWDAIIKYGPLVAFGIFGGIAGVGYILNALGVAFG